MSTSSIDEELLNDEDYLAYQNEGGSSGSDSDSNNDSTNDNEEQTKQINDNKKGPKICQLCGDCRRTSLHHLIPKLIIKREKKRSRKSKKYQERRNFTEVHLVRLCKWCHSKLHKCFTHKELSEQYSTVELICEHPQMITYLKWKRKKAAHYNKIKNKK
ncbi:hypothetical protein M0812_20671 [Anaeramoeba flamelloides]|uniref:Uncharacterized protein n=1 Tax=Anaeramoeba flamelloides TaxID=1746091 RepID=A0AAV7YS31_9EUKA|nr:hypothetical protein M0812_20671 [Anaeramoeba flamelloides]